MADERFTALPTAEEITLFREAYAETYPVRPLLNAIDAKDAEIERLRMEADVARIQEVVIGNLRKEIKTLSAALAEAIDWLRDTDTEGTRVRLERWRKAMPESRDG